MAIERIGILTSAGDCAGLYAVICAVVHRVIQGYGWQVLESTKECMDDWSNPWLAKSFI